MFIQLLLITFCNIPMAYKLCWNYECISWRLLEIKAKWFPSLTALLLSVLCKVTNVTWNNRSVLGLDLVTNFWQVSDEVFLKSGLCVDSSCDGRKRKRNGRQTFKKCILWIHSLYIVPRSCIPHFLQKLFHCVNHPCTHLPTQSHHQHHPFPSSSFNHFIHFTSHFCQNYMHHFHTFTAILLTFQYHMFYHLILSHVTHLAVMGGKVFSTAPFSGI